MRNGAAFTLVRDWGSGGSPLHGMFGLGADGVASAWQARQRSRD